ncbi:MAG: isoprenylcysteine carboxylmethyltransferase family protein [Alphaproteobacteria bacterium]|nr:isoprenylcysteine carboxylmethyltransferase family protein [Alphaproteobacteria bacterium]
MSGQNVDTPPDSPDVLTFPPVIFIIFYVIGYVTDRAFPADLGTLDIRYAIGGVLIALSVALVAWAVTHFLRAKTHVDVRKPATALVTGGPYRLSRNPMYLAMTLLYAGFAVTFSLPITLTLLIPCLVLLHHGVISREETYLERKFGDEYRAYKARVRRWL